MKHFVGSLFPWVLGKMGSLTVLPRFPNSILIKKGHKLCFLELGGSQANVRLKGPMALIALMPSVSMRLRILYG